MLLSFCARWSTGKRQNWKLFWVTGNCMAVFWSLTENLFFLSTGNKDLTKNLSLYMKIKTQNNIKKYLFSICDIWSLGNRK